MVKEKKNNSWDNIQGSLDAPQNVDDWDVEKAPNDEKGESSRVENNADKTTDKSTKTKKTIVSGAKTKSAKSRKKAAKPRTVESVALALEKADEIDASPKTESVDFTVAETPKRRRRATTKKNADEKNDLAANVAQIEKEDAEKAKKRAAKNNDDNPFQTLFSQVDQIANREEEADAQETIEQSALVENAVEPEVDDKSTLDDLFNFNFECDDSLEISWGKPSRSFNASENVPSAEIKPEANDAQQETAEPNVEERVEERIEERENAPQRATRRDRKERRRRRVESEKIASDEARFAEPEKTDVATEIVAVDLDNLDNLDAFFATPDDDGIGFAPRRQDTKRREEKPQEENRREEKSQEENRREEKSQEENRREEKPQEENRRDKRQDKRREKCETPEIQEEKEPEREFAFEDDEPVRRKRRRNGRRAFADETTDSRDGKENAVEIEQTLAVVEPENDDASVDEPREHRRERRPRRERENRPERDAALDESSDAAQRVLPSWDDAVSYVVRFNLSRRVNRRKN